MIYLPIWNNSITHPEKVFIKTIIETFSDIMIYGPNQFTVVSIKRSSFKLKIRIFFSYLFWYMYVHTA